MRVTRKEDGRSLSVRCPACEALRGQPCTQRIRDSRFPLEWIHYARMHEYDQEDATL